MVRWPIRNWISGRVHLQVLRRSYDEALGRRPCCRAPNGNAWPPTWTRLASDSSDVLFVAGCDHLGLRTLENLIRQARSSGLQTVLILEHLRDDLQKLLGDSDSASLIMRLGNAREAATAAEFIGREHTFVPNQVTYQLSDAATDGESKQWGPVGSSRTPTLVPVEPGSAGRAHTPSAGPTVDREP